VLSQLNKLDIDRAYVRMDGDASNER